jgi:hypothetical protein
MMSAFNATRFLDQGYDFVRLDISQLPIDAVLDGWSRFLDQPISTKKRWKIPTTHYYDPDPGYFRKEGKWDEEIEEFSDEKQYFHWNPDLRTGVNNRLVDPVSVEELDRWSHWLAAQQHVHSVCHAAYMRACQAIDEIHGQPALVPHTTGSSILRTMQYDAGKPGKAHTDKGCLTIEVAKTHPGLIINGASIDAPPGSLLIFGSRKAAHLLGRPEIAKDHKALAYEGVDGEARKVIILFGQAYCPKLRKED